MTSWRHVEVNVSTSMLLWTSLPVEEVERRADNIASDALLEAFCTCPDNDKEVGGESNPDHMTRMFWPCEAAVGSGHVHVIDGSSALRKAYGEDA